MEHFYGQIPNIFLVEMSQKCFITPEFGLPWFKYWLYFFVSSLLSSVDFRMSGSNFYFQFSHRLYMSYRLWYSSVAGFYQEAFGHVTCNLSGCCIVAFIMFMLYYVSFYFLLVQVFLRTSALIHLPFEI